MREREKRGLLPAVRRGIALAMALVALWAVVRTADLPGAGEALAALGDRPAIAVGLLARQMGAPPEDAIRAELGGMGGLLLDTSPLLAAGTDAVARLRQERAEQENAQQPEDLDEDDIEQPDLSPSRQEEGVIETTGKGKEGGQYLSREGIYLYNRTDLSLTPEVLTQGTVDLALKEGPQILIYHTHGSEAYSQADGEVYTESDPYRTTDCTHNVVRVGEKMAEVFRAYGFEVVHDTTLYDYPAYSGAYDRSGAAVKQWLEEYPTIQLALDVHRDALQGSDGSIYKMVSQENGEKVAQVMLVIGTGEERTDWKNNLALAVEVQKELAADYVSLARPMVLRSSKYNQDLLPGALLVEVGGHGNTLTEALAGARLFAESASQVLLGLRQ
ncbi:MAG: stage II sporulation protein P [Clostridium sp.]|nr:stage II sporulation protein P [Clostridium sp.]